MLKPDKPESLQGLRVTSGNRLGYIHNTGRSGRMAFVVWEGSDCTAAINWQSIELVPEWPVVELANNGGVNHGN